MGIIYRRCENECEIASFQMHNWGVSCVIVCVLNVKEKKFTNFPTCDALSRDLFCFYLIYLNVFFLYLLVVGTEVKPFLFLGG